METSKKSAQQACQRGRQLLELDGERAGPAQCLGKCPNTTTFCAGGFAFSVVMMLEQLFNCEIRTKPEIAICGCCWASAIASRVLPLAHHGRT